MADKIEIVIDAKDEAKGAFASVGNGIKTLVGAAAGVMAAKVGFDALKEGILGSVAAANESAKVAAQTEAVLKSTGGAAGVTGDMVSDLATKLSGITPIDDEVIQSTENMLLTFTNIKSNIFPDVTKTALDMSVALGQDTKNSAIQLGKALNDPITGVTALQRVGVTFTDQQKEQIKTLVESGNVMGAQKLILGELTKEFGGSAEAAGKTFGGQLAILKTQLGNVQEAIGGALVPILSRFASAVMPTVVDWLNRFAAALPGIVDAISGPLVAGFHVLQGALQFFRAGNMQGEMNGILLLQDALFSVFGPDTGLAITNVVVAIMDRVKSLAGTVMGIARTGFVIARDALLTFIQALQGNWTDNSKILGLHRVIGLIGEIIRNQVIPAFQRFTVTALPLLQQLAAWFLGTALPAIQQFAAQASAFITGTLLPAFQRFVASVLPMLQQLMAWLLGIGLPAIRQFVTSAVQFITGQLIPTFQRIANTVLPVLQQVVSFIQAHWQPILAGVAASVVTVLIPALIAWTATTWANVAAHVALAVATVAAYLPIIAIVAAVGVAVGLLYAAWQSNFLGIQGIVASVWGAVQPVLQAIWDRLSAFVDTLLPLWAAAWPQIQAAVSAAVSAAQSVIEALWGVIQAVFGAIAGFLSDHGAQIQAILSAAWSAIQTVIDSTLAIISNLIQLVLNVISGNWSGAWDNIKAILSAAWDAIQAVVSSYLTIVQNLIQIGLDAAKAIFEAVWNALPGVVSGAWGLVQGAVSAGISAIQSAFAGAASWLYQAGRDIVAGLARGIIDSAAAALDAARSVASSIVSTVKSFGQSPWPDMIESGRDIVDGLVQGMDDAQQEAVKKAADVAKSIIDTLSAGLKFAQDAAAFGGALPGDDLIAGLKFMTEHMVQSLGDSAALMTTEFLDQAKAYAAAAKEGWSVLGGALDFASKFATAMQAGNLTLPTDQFISDLKFLTEHAVQSLGDSAALMSGPFLDGAKQFSSAGKAAFDALGGVVTFLTNLDKIKDIDIDASVKQLTSFLIEFSVQVTQAFAASAGRLSSESLDAAASFADAAKSVFDAVKPAIDAIDGLVNMSVLTDSMIQRFLDNLTKAFAAIGQLPDAASLPLKQAQAFAQAAKSIADALQSGIDVLKPFGVSVSINGVTAGASAPGGGKRGGSAPSASGLFNPYSLPGTHAFTASMPIQVNVDGTPLYSKVQTQQFQAMQSGVSLAGER